jgi:N-acetylglucosamine malate deacetylase 1
VGINEVMHKKRQAIEQMPSQFSDKDSWTWGRRDDVPEDEEVRLEMRVGDLIERNVTIADEYRDLLIELYGEEAGSGIRHAEAFELSEFGRQVSVEELKRLFPAFD